MAVARIFGSDINSEVTKLYMA